MPARELHQMPLRPPLEISIARRQLVLLYFNQLLEHGLLENDHPREFLVVSGYVANHLLLLLQVQSDKR